MVINTYVPDGWINQVNAADAAFIRQHANAVLAGWSDTIVARFAEPGGRTVSGLDTPAARVLR